MAQWTESETETFSEWHHAYFTFWMLPHLSSHRTWKRGTIGDVQSLGSLAEASYWTGDIAGQQTSVSLKNFRGITGKHPVGASSLVALISCLAIACWLLSTFQLLSVALEPLHESPHLARAANRACLTCWMCSRVQGASDVHEHQRSRRCLSGAGAGKQPPPWQYGEFSFDACSGRLGYQQGRPCHKCAAGQAGCAALTIAGGKRRSSRSLSRHVGHAAAICAG